jgi:hypothetical protein
VIAAAAGRSSGIGPLGTRPQARRGHSAGFAGNPSPLAFANSRAADERIIEGYAALFAVDAVAKAVFVHVILGVAT